MANVKRNQLNTRKVKSLSEPGTYTDGAGLTLRLQPTGSKSWVLRLTVEEKRRNYGLGGYPDVSLAEARAQARAMRSRARQGLDPVVNEAPRIPQFTEAAETVIGLRPPTWSSPPSRGTVVRESSTSRPPGPGQETGRQDHDRRRADGLAADLDLQA